MNEFVRISFAAAIMLAPASALAGGAYVVDDAEVAKPGECTVSSWASAASNHDFIAVAHPTCVVNVGKPVELGGQLQRSRGGDDWSTSGTFTAKTNLVPLEQHPFGLGIAGGATWNLITGASTGGFIYVPVTIQAAKQLKINLNGGWQYDNVAKISYATWGAGFEWGFADKFTLIGEVFGQAGALPAVEPDDPPPPNSIIQPRTQIGVRFAPNEKFDVDLIWGHNITGENAHWVTLGLNVHFDAGR